MRKPIKIDAQQQAAVDALQAVLDKLAQRDAAFAGGPHLTAGCSFCSKPLNDQRSLSVGYGTVCAKHFGLAWG